MDAKKNRMGGKEALELARAADEIWVAKGQKVVRFDMKKDPPDREALLASMLGPTGNLRAPSLRVGRTLLIGFNEETYSRIFG